MAIDIDHYRALLRTKEKELREEIGTFDEAGRDSRTADVEDALDEVTSSQAKAAAFGVSDIAANTLLAVQAALQRIEDGEYGNCLDCGKPIPPKRLDAVPWTPYCIEDQEKHDAEAKREGGAQDPGQIA